ncbi:MAG TPA: FGGY family carbohydrate kinase [Armatimonadota bacterium]|nr:FGGY family carbohydrate kinase [Armatimonadota bacterium]
MSAAHRYILGIDLGTSACKVCLVDDAGTLCHTAQATYQTYCPHTGWMEQEPQDWLHAVTDATRHVCATAHMAPGEIAGIALTSAAHIGVLLDAHGSPVCRSLLWNDQRATAEVDELAASCGELIRHQTFQTVSTTWTLPHLLWIQRHWPAAWARTRQIMLSKDFVLCWLTGQAVTDPATALSSLLYNATADAWSAAICQHIGIDPAWLPPVAPATAVAGGVTQHTAAELGIPAGTPVVVGTLDSATELYAAGVLAPGQCQLRLATAGGLQCVLPQATAQPPLITYPHPVTPRWYCQAGTNSCASAVRWGTHLLGGGHEVTFADWDAWAAAAPVGCNGLFFHPYLSGERAPYWDAHLRASFIGAGMEHGTAHFARAIYEGTAFSLRDAMRAIPNLPHTDDPLCVTGGGSRSAVWLHIIADVLQRTLAVTEHADSSYGAALLGLVGLGQRDLLAASPYAHEEQLIEPIPAHAEQYTDFFQRYRHIHDALASLYRSH